MEGKTFVSCGFGEFSLGFVHEVVSVLSEGFFVMRCMRLLYSLKKIRDKNEYLNLSAFLFLRRDRAEFKKQNAPSLNSSQSSRLLVIAESLTVFIISQLTELLRQTFFCN